MRFTLSLIATLALGANALTVPLEKRWYTTNPDLPPGVLAQLDMGYSSNGQYLLPLSVGTPAQSGFNVVFDTGSDVSWLPTSSACPDCQSTYDPSGSSTAFKDGDKKETIDYDNGQCATVQMYKDTITWGTWDVKYQNFPIGAATELENFDTSSDQVGYIGLGNPDALHSIISANEAAYPNAGDAKKIKKRSQSGSWGIQTGSGNAAGGGDKRRSTDSFRVQLTLGVNAEAYTGELYYFNLPASESDCENQSIFWRTALKGVGLKDTYDCDVLPGSYAKFSTGTNAIKAPPVQADILHLKFGAIYNIFEHRYEFKCSKTVPDLELQFENYQINVPASLWTARIDPDDVSDDAKCYSYIHRGSDRFKEWTIGTRILNEFYKVFDYDMLRMGLAKPADGSSVATITNIS